MKFFKLKILLRIVLGIIFLIVIGISGLLIYFNYNKDFFSEKIQQVFAENLNGTLDFKDLTINFTNNFPSVSVSLKEVEIGNSMVSTMENSKIAKFEDISIALSMSDLFQKNIDFDKISIHGADIHLYTDENGISNTNNLIKKKEEKPKKESDFSLQHLVLELDDSKLLIEDKKKNKRFDFDVHSFETTLNKSDDKYLFENDLDVQVNGLAFNLEKGAFLNDAKFKADFIAEFNEQEKSMKIPSFKAEIDEQDFMIEAILNFSEQANYRFDIQNEATNYTETIALLSSNIAEKLKGFHFQKPLDVNATLTGEFGFGKNPDVKVNFQTNENELHINDKTNFKNVQFKGSFRNLIETNDSIERDSGKDVLVKFETFSADYKGVNFKLKDSWFQDAEQMQSMAKINATADGESIQLNELFGTKDFSFKSGTYSFRTNYIGEVKDLPTLFRDLDCHFKVDNTKVHFNPNNTDFDIQAVHLDIVKNTAQIKTFILKSYDTNRTLNLSGNIKNVTGIAFDKSVQPETNIHLTAKKIDLEKLIEWLSPTKSKQKNSTKKSGLKVLMSEIYANFRPKLTVSVNELVYGHFDASNVNLALDFRNSKDLRLSKTSLKYAGGTINIGAGFVFNSAQTTNLKLNINTNRVHLGEFLKDLDCLNIKSLQEAESISGLLNLNAKLNANFTNGELLGKSLNGQIDFAVNNGRIKGFEPLQKIGDAIKNKQRFNDVRFAPIKNKFTLKNGNVHIPQMPIFSDAIHCYVEGNFSYVGKTNLWVSVPLANLSGKKLDDLKVVPYNHSGSKIFVEIKEQNGKFKYKPHLTNKELYRQKGILDQYKEDKKAERKARRALRRNARKNK